jgi:hypothetical protein
MYQVSFSSDISFVSIGAGEDLERLDYRKPFWNLIVVILAVASLADIHNNTLLPSCENCRKRNRPYAYPLVVQHRLLQPHPHQGVELNPQSLPDVGQPSPRMSILPMSCKFRWMYLHAKLKICIMGSPTASC